MSRDLSNKRELANYRMERARATLQDARNLISQSSSPASTVNRAYYSMFYATLAILATIGQKTSKHQGVLALFDQHFIKPGILPKEMGRFLHKVFDMRQTGDYEEEAELTEIDAQDAIVSAEKFIEAIEEKFRQDKWL